MIYQPKRQKIIAIMVMAIAVINPISAVGTGIIPIEQTKFCVGLHNPKVHDSFSDIPDTLKQKLDPEKFVDCKVMVIEYSESTYGVKLEYTPECKIVIYEGKRLFDNIKGTNRLYVWRISFETLQKLLMTQDFENIAKLKDAWKMWKQSLFKGLVIGIKVYQEHPELLSSLVEMVNETSLDECDDNLKLGNNRTPINIIQNIINLLLIHQNIKPEIKERFAKELEYYHKMQKCAKVLLDYGVDWDMSDSDSDPESKPIMVPQKLPSDIKSKIQEIKTKVLGDRAEKAIKQDPLKPILEECIFYEMLDTKVLQFADLPSEVQSKFDCKGWDNQKLILCKDGKHDAALVRINIQSDGSYALNQYSTIEAQKAASKQILHAFRRIGFDKLKELLTAQDPENIAKLVAAFIKCHNSMESLLNCNPIIFEDQDALNGLVDKINENTSFVAKDIAEQIDGKALVNAIINIQALVTNPRVKPEMKSKLKEILDIYKYDLVPNIGVALEPWLDSSTWEVLDK